MAKIVRKTNKRRIRIEGVAFLMFTFAIVGVLFSSLFIRAEKNNLTMHIEDIKNECINLKEKNSQLNIEIQNLISKDRIYEIAANNGLDHNEDNVINVANGD